MSTPPFTFAWVNEDQTTFDPDTMNLFDETILSFKIQHEEGQVPTLDIEIKNPRIGLLSPGRKQWAWIAWLNPETETLVPLFFGVLVGIPTNMFKETITLQILARSPTFIEDKQAVAESLKVAPYYDPIWLDPAHRDEPDSILEGYSALWHIDRTTLGVSASDILEGEDGTVTFDEDHAFYDSVAMELDQPPLSIIRVEAQVNWRQRYSGFFPVPPVALASYTGDTFLSGWPKAGAAIGGGYKVEASFVTDVYNIAATPTTSFNSTWTNTDPNPGQCSNASASQASSGPALLSPDPLTCVLTSQFTTGDCDPFSDPPTNTPMSLSVTGMIVPLWYMSGSMTVRYDADRQYSELIAFNMTCNTQAVLTSPTVSQNTELMKVTAVDVGEPLIEVDAWSDFKNSAVALAQIIFPNNPTTPGGTSYQVCVQAGTAGATEPVFSDIPGETTNDNTVVWASLGEQPLTNVPRWSGASQTPRGTIVLLVDQTFNTASGEFEDVPNTGTYYIATTQGITNSTYRTFTYVPPVENNEGGTPAPRVVNNLDQPNYVTTPGSLVQDGTVQWTVLGVNPPLLQIPIGGTATTVTARSFFPMPRGQRALEYLICKARARLRFRARAVRVSWDCKFDDAVSLTCRKNATLFDPRLPGGAATGKIKSYTLSAGGNGELRGHVEIGCSVGFGQSVPEVSGVPGYALPGYAQLGWQLYIGKTVDPGSGDTTYTPPAFVAFDDGLQYPLNWTMVSDGGLLSSTIADQKAVIEASFKIEQELQYLQSWGSAILAKGVAVSKESGTSPDEAWKLEREQLALASQATPYVMEANPITWTALIKPCVSGPFEGSYAVTVSPLEVPQGINLEALSSP